jgi:hypothetical protein
VRGNVKMEIMIWNTLLTAAVALVGFLVMGKFKEIDRVTILLNKTREEVARDHITRAEYSRDLEKLGDRFEAAFLRLESKIDEIGKKGPRSTQ